ncbi:MAG: serine hydrolase [Chitinophagaceae bacterium]
MNSRRKFIKTTGAGAIGLGLLPAFNNLESIFGFGAPIALPRTSPEAQGISSAAVRNFIKAANESAIGLHSFMLMRHGNVVAEGWWKPFEPQYKHTLYSLSKSFTSTAIGLLVTEGKITVNDLVTSFFKDELPATVSGNLAKMKIKNLLTMNTGHKDDTMPKMREGNATWTKTFLAQPVEFEPGSHFLYNTGATYMLGAIVHKVTGQTLAAYLKPRLFDPLEITGFDWEVSPQGLNTAGYGLRVRTEDIAKFGQMYLQKGQWNNKQILPAAWVEEATKYQTSSQEGNGDWSQGYGYQFWRCKPGFFRGDGAFGQYCIVMPQHDAVLAVTAESWNMQQQMTTMWDNLLPGMHDGSLSENANELSELKKDLKNLVLPVVKGSTQSSAASKYNGKKIKMDANDYGAESIQFKFSNDGCTWTIKTATGDSTIKAGWEKWQSNNDTAKYAFPAPGRLHMPSKIAGTATWVNENTLQLNLRFTEAMHGDKVTCTFDGNKVSVSFLNTVAENTKTNPESRKAITGTV